MGAGTTALRSICALAAVARASGRLFNAGTNGCGITGVQYVVREGEDKLSGALVSMTCGTSGCTDEETYSTGVKWEHVYYFLQTGLPDGLHLVTSCENSLYQPVQVGSNAADATWYGVAVIGW